MSLEHELADKLFGEFKEDGLETEHHELLRGLCLIVAELSLLRKSIDKLGRELDDVRG